MSCSLKSYNKFWPQKNGRSRTVETTEVPVGKDLEMNIRLLVEFEQISQIQRISRKSFF